MPDALCRLLTHRSHPNLQPRRHDEAHCHPASEIPSLVSFLLGSVNQGMTPRCPADSRGLALLKFSKEEDLARNSLVENWGSICKVVSGLPLVVRGLFIAAHAGRGDYNLG